MISSALQQLLSIASRPLGSSADIRVKLGESPAEKELEDMLSRLNGFYAFESALHVFPAGPAENNLDLERWNSPGLWREAYKDMTNGHLFFAEDLFGMQFSIKEGSVMTFDPETGEAEFLAGGLERWAEMVLSDESLTGFPIAHSWQLLHGRVPAGMRLIPKRPFVLGGEYSVDNLYLLNAVEGMRLRAEIATQVRYLPDGSVVELEIEN